MSVGMFWGHTLSIVGLFLGATPSIFAVVPSLYPT